MILRGESSTLSQVLGWAYRRNRLFPISNDLAAWFAGLLLGAGLKLAFDIGIASTELLVTALVAVAIHALLGTAVGVYRHRWRVSSFEETSALALVWAVTAFIVTVGTFVSRRYGTDLPTSATLAGSMSAFTLMGLCRVVWRRFWEQNRRPNPDRCKRTIVFGAGSGGEQTVRAMLADSDSQYFPIALVDDDPMKRHRSIAGIPVVGTRADLALVAAQTDAEVLLIAIPSANRSLIQEMSDVARDLSLELLVLPAASEMLGRMTLADLRPPTVDDLLGRDPVEIDLDSIADYIRGKRVLITGAGGSIGSELSRQVRGFAPSGLRLLDRDESALHGLQLSMDGRALLDSDTLVVADIRDRDRIFELFHDFEPEVVFHTAALKHLTLLENHPVEGIKTNAVGTKNLLDAALSSGVGRFVNISTDKAADPTSVLGATKLAAERLTALAAKESGRHFVSVRFGNVLGSRGSVIPTFLGQLEQGKPITLTDPDVTRYFMTIPEAVRLVVQAGAIGEPGEVMILDMGEPVKIIDLANRLIDSVRPGTPIEITGLRPGEKLHEILRGEDEVGVVKKHPRISHTDGSVDTPADALYAVADELVDECERRLAEVDPLPPSSIEEAMTG